MRPSGRAITAGVGDTYDSISFFEHHLHASQIERQGLTHIYGKAMLFQEFGKSPSQGVFHKIRGGIDILFDLSNQDTFLAPLLQSYKLLYHSTMADHLHELLVEYHDRTVALKKDLKRIGRLISFVLSGVVSVCTSSTESNDQG